MISYAETLKLSYTIHVRHRVTVYNTEIEGEKRKEKKKKHNHTGISSPDENSTTHAQTTTTPKNN